MDKNFIVRCHKCRWAKVTSGLKRDLEDLVEIPSNCSNCGKPREFRCPNCGLVAKMNRIKRQSP